jgi:hypothetical protein
MSGVQGPNGAPTNPATPRGARHSIACVKIAGERVVLKLKSTPY